MRREAGGPGGDPQQGADQLLTVADRYLRVTPGPPHGASELT